MQNIVQPPKKPSDGGAGLVTEASLSPEATARRLVLLKGLGRGAAVLAASVPIQTLASQSVLTPDLKHQCTISGMHSGVHSATTTTTVCGGYSPGWWGQSDDGIKPKRTWPGGANHLALVTTVCPWSTLMTTATSTVTAHVPTLFEVMEKKDPLSKFSNTDEYHWVCAWLNALGGYFNFPYSALQVLDFAKLKSSDPAKYLDALTFFKTYMETHTS